MKEWNKSKKSFVKGGHTSNEETAKQYDVYDAVSQSNVIIDEDGIFNGVYKLADNVTITINYNNELA